MEVLLDMNNGEIIQRGIEEFREVQDYMILAKEEDATNILQFIFQISCNTKICFIIYNLLSF